MARPKKYERHEALENARDAFWKYGYDALGVRAIEQHTKLNRFAIQTEFGGKEGLFLEILDKYAEDAIDQIMAPLQDGSLNAIRDFFSQSITPEKNDPRTFGCLMVNTVIENASQHRDALKSRTDAHYERMLDAFRSALTNARNDGEVADNFDIEEAACFLLTLAMGMQVYIRMHGSLSAANQQTKMALKTIESWRS